MLKATREQLIHASFNLWLGTSIALVITVIWLLGCAIYVLGVSNVREQATGSGLALMITAFIILFPVIMIWVVAHVSNSVSLLQNEVNALRSTMGEIKGVLSGGPIPENKRDAAVQEQLTQIAELTLKTDRRLNELTKNTPGNVKTSKPQTPPHSQQRTTAATTGVTQIALPLEPPTDPTQMAISVDDFIKALNFPENDQDMEGFRVLRRAFRDQELGSLLHAAQDVLTILSQDGLYMDDLVPEKPVAKAWRSFAHGQEGPTVLALGGMNDQSAITIAKTRVNNDPIFRDLVQHFLRKFHHMVVAFESVANDDQLVAMACTRSARAFMLLELAKGTIE